MTLTNIEGVALYAQIREKIREQIAGGDLKPGEKLPPEEELAAQLGVSRMTMRRGILDLIDEGALYRRRGVGTFVARRHIERNHNRLTSYLDSAAEEGFTPELKCCCAR